MIELHSRMNVALDGKFPNGLPGLLPPEEMEAAFQKVAQAVKEILVEELSIEQYIDFSVEETEHSFNITEDAPAEEEQPDEEA